MRRLSITTHLFLLSAAITTGILCMFFFIILPTMGKLQDVQRDLREQKDRMTLERERALDPARSLDELASTTAKMKQFDMAMVETGKELTLIESLEALAVKEGVQLTLTVQEANKDRYTFSFDTKGPYEKQLSFLHALERLPYYLLIDAIDMKKYRGDNNEELVSNRFTATIYVHTP
ncbi:MAG TPA: hypothetical protein VEA18_01960 [Candidatus Kapabacteria bacterium]|nr:hypothetical protein [Candidatus Kapabacteria bacterium]